MFSLLSSPCQGLKKSTSSRRTKPDQDWIVLEQDSASENAPVASSRELVKENNLREDHGPLLNVEDNHHAVRQQPDDSHDLLSSINTQRTELAAMMNAILKSQAHEQEERELFQAQFYASKIEQEEREARHLQDEEASGKPSSKDLEALFAKILDEHNEQLQCLRVELDATKAASNQDRELLVTLQKQVDELKRDSQLQTAPLQGQIGEVAAQTSELAAAVAKYQLGYVGQAVGQLSPSQGITLQESRGGVQGAHPYDSTHGGVRLPPAYTNTAQRHSSKLSQYDCEWYLPEP